MKKVTFGKNIKRMIRVRLDGIEVGQIAILKDENGRVVGEGYWAFRSTLPGVYGPHPLAFSTYLTGAPGLRWMKETVSRRLVKGPPVDTISPAEREAINALLGAFSGQETP